MSDSRILTEEEIQVGRFLIALLQDSGTDTHYIFTKPWDLVINNLENLNIFLFKKNGFEPIKHVLHMMIKIATSCKIKLEQLLITAGVYEKYTVNTLELKLDLQYMEPIKQTVEKYFTNIYIYANQDLFLTINVDTQNFTKKTLVHRPAIT